MSSGVRTGGQLLVDTLAANGVTHVFCVPGESYLAVLDALLDADIKVITCRHEAAAANMAEAHGKLTGKPGVCMVTRGPGATQAAVGVHTAFQDSTPLLLFVGQVSRADKGREAFQELDYPLAFGGLAKSVEEVGSAARMAEVVMRALASARNGRPGPVVIALPEDVLVETAAARSGPADDAIFELQMRLSRAERPLVLLGGPGWSLEALRDVRAFAERSDLAVATTFRAKDLFDNSHPNYVGDVGIAPNPKLAERVKAADLLLVIGARLGEMTTSGYTLLESPVPRQHLIHVHASAEELGRVFQPVLAIQSSMGPFAESLRSVVVEGGRWADWRAGARADYEAWIKPVAASGAVNLSKVIHHLDAALPHDAILTNGAGNFAGWLHRFYQHRSWKTQLAPTSGAMGYGLPAAIAAKIVHPEREVVCVAGDGDFLMAGNDLATAARYNAALIVLVVNNGAYGTIRMHQERDYPGRVSATELTNPDFVAYAQSFGCAAFKVTETSQFPAALQAARQAGKPALIELVTSVTDIAPGRTLDLGKRSWAAL
jgi:acetolactate synthase I/II/III large subunit